LLGQINIHGKDKVQVAIDRLREFEPSEGYYLAFSGGKDSLCIYHLAKEAGVKFDAHYNLTGIDPPELVYFIRENYPDVIIDRPRKTMWQLIVENGTPPTRIMRYCCAHLKEKGGEGRICVTGVRWAESVRRRKTRRVIEQYGKSQILFNDNNEVRRLMENCQKKSKFILNPIIDWEDDDVWEYIRSRHLKYCSLYDDGFKRLGCIGCPMGTTKQRLMEFERWPKYKNIYLRTFDRMLQRRIERERPTLWASAEEVMQWWIHGKGTKEKVKL
jgi:phosphoadenosine phosphosulfate reductase